MDLVTRVQASEKRAGGTRVLCYAEAWGQGGIESFLMSLFRKLQGNGFSFEIFSTWDWNQAMDSELEALGIPRWTVFPGHKPGQIRRLRDGSAAFGQLIESRRPHCVYINTMNGMGFLYSEVAMRMGVPVRAVHSHSTAYGSGNAVAKAIAHAFGRNTLGSSANIRLAVSRNAGKYLFGEMSFEVLPNGIDTDLYTFDETKRDLIRAKLGIPKKSPVFGSIGRLSEEKNPFFQIQVFTKILEHEPDAYYLMVGDGPLHKDCMGFVDDLGLSQRVIFTGYLSNAVGLYSVLDCFLMPSIFEGLAMSCVEAQAAGCPILCSLALPAEAHVTNLEHTMPLDAGETKWAETAVALLNESADRFSYAIKVKDAGFDAKDTASKLASLLSDGIIK